MNHLFQILHFRVGVMAGDNYKAVAPGLAIVFSSFFFYLEFEDNSRKDLCIFDLVELSGGRSHPEYHSKLFVQ